VLLGYLLNTVSYVTSRRDCEEQRQV